MIYGNMVKTLFLYYDPHYSHAELAKAVNAYFFPAPKLVSGPKSLAKKLIGIASILYSVFTIPKGYEVYLCEGTYIFPALAKKIGLIKRESLIIDILASPLVYYLNTGVVDGLEKKFALDMLKYVDGFICIGKMEEELIKNLIPSARTMITYPFPKPELRKELLKQSHKTPDFDSNKILMIGRGDAYYKGIDILSAAFKIVKEKFPNSELDIVGEAKWLKSYGDNGIGIKILGFIKDITGIMKSSSLYVHLGRGDAFPVSSMEAMLAGLPTIVSNETGTKEVVKKVNKNLIVPLNANEVAKKIEWYFRLKRYQKIKLSKELYKSIKPLNKKDIIHKFKKDYKKFISDLLIT